MWHLHEHIGTIQPFNNLTELAKSIKTTAKQKFRLAPSEYGKHFSWQLYNSNGKEFIRFCF